jgi:threonine dehydrogenase-like Zn-dependent dehydrogenase
LKISVIGVGHVGLVTAACMADLGHDVVGMDDDAAKVDLLVEGRMPFFEPDLAELVAAGREAGRLRFTGDAGEAVAGAEVVFICVGTPTKADGSPDLSFVQAAAAASMAFFMTFSFSRPSSASRTGGGSDRSSGSTATSAAPSGRSCRRARGRSATTPSSWS